MFEGSAWRDREGALGPLTSTSSGPDVTPYSQFHLVAERHEPGLTGPRSQMTQILGRKIRQ